MAFKGDDTCLANVADDEPIFVLRAQDALAPGIVFTWATLAQFNGVPATKCAEARRVADQMVQWQVRNKSGKIPD